MPRDQTACEIPLPDRHPEHRAWEKRRPHPEQAAHGADVERTGCGGVVHTANTGFARVAIGIEKGRIETDSDGDHGFEITSSFRDSSVNPTVWLL